MSLPPFIYRETSPEERVWGCAVTAWGHAKIGAGVSYPLDGHPSGHAFSWESGRRLSSYQLIYVPSGSGRFESEASQPHEIHPGNVILLFPHVWHRYRPHAETGWEEWWFEFSGPVPHNLLREGVLQPRHPIYAPGDQAELRRLLHELSRHAMETKAGAAGIMSVLALSILATLHSWRLQHSEFASPAEIETAKIHQSAQVLRKRQAETIDLSRLAEDMGMSYTAWRRSFKRQLGVSPGQFLLDCRLRTACHLLSATNYPVGEIAERCGFRSMQHFSRIFRSKTRTAPMHYRTAARSGIEERGGGL